jgi:hypothetical protein
MPDYSNGKIYRLTCYDPNLVYYGSTIQTLKARLRKHRCNDCVKKCSSKKLFEVGGVEIELVLECPCNTLIELREIEQTYIDNDDCINKINACHNKEEYEKSEKRIISRKLANEKYHKSDKGIETKKNYRLKQKALKNIN